MNTHTPRTSAAIIASGFQAVPEGFRVFARNLEAELIALTTERDQLRAEVEHYKFLHQCESDSSVEAFARAERAEAEVSKLTDALDMMRDEFMRIIACPGCNAEIEDLANRAQLKLIQRVPVITQRDRAETELAKERARMDWCIHHDHLVMSSATGFSDPLKHQVIVYDLVGAQTFETGFFDTEREAIDAAMKEETK